MKRQQANTAWIAYTQGLTAMCAVLLIAFVVLSWSQKPTTPSWQGEDSSTAFMYCAMNRPAESLKDGEFRLTRHPALNTSLSTVLLTPYPQPNIQTTVYLDTSFSAEVLKEEQIWISEAKYGEFVQAIADTGILKSAPTSRITIDDGTWYGLEHCFSGKCLGYGENDWNVMNPIVRAFKDYCGDTCSQAFRLADATIRGSKFGEAYVSCRR